MANDLVSIVMLETAGGGAERAILQVADWAARAGDRIELVVVRNDRYPVPPSDRPFSTVHLGFDHVIRWAPRVASRLAGYLRDRQPATVLSVLNLTNLLVTRARRLARSNCRLVLCEQNTLSRGLPHGPWILRLLGRRLTRASYPAADRVIAVSTGVARDLAEEFGVPPQRLVVIPNPVDLRSIASQAAQAPDHPWFRDGGVPVILAVGRLTHQKGFDVLLDAFAAVRRRAAARLMILGAGEERDRLLERARRLGVRDDFELSGFVAAPASYMSRCAVFVLSSRWEGLPLVLVEALAAGCPIVSTACPSGPDEILEQGRHGHLVAMESPEGLAEAIQRVFAGEVRNAGSRRRAEDFAIETIAPRYRDVLLEIPPAGGLAPSRTL